MLWNPYRNYDKGMDDAYMGLEPIQPNSQQYMEGYEYSQMLNNEQEAERSVATKIRKEQNDNKQQ